MTLDIEYCMKNPHKSFRDDWLRILRESSIFEEIGQCTFQYPYSLLPTPYSLLPTQLLPAPCSLGTYNRISSNSEQESNEVILKSTRYSYNELVALYLLYFTLLYLRYLPLSS